MQPEKGELNNFNSCYEVVAQGSHGYFRPFLNTHVRVLCQPRVGLKVQSVATLGDGMFIMACFLRLI